MARRKASDKQARSARPTREQMERELDEIGESLLSGGLTEAPSTLEQLWSARKEMPAILTQRLIEERALVPRFEFELLGLMAAGRAEFVEEATLGRLDKPAIKRDDRRPSCSRPSGEGRQESRLAHATDAVDMDERRSIRLKSAEQDSQLGLTR